MTFASICGNRFFAPVQAAFANFTSSALPTLRPVFAKDANVTRQMLDNRQPGACVLNRMADELQTFSPVLAADLRRSALSR